MEELFGNYNVMMEDVSVGTLKVSAMGIRALFECVCRPDVGGILRLMCLCDGQHISLGVLLPENDTFHLHKTFTKNALRDMGLYRIDSCFISGGMAVPALPLAEDTYSPPPPEKEIPPTASAEKPPPPPPSPEPRFIPEDWQLETSPARLFKDPDVAAACRGVVGAMSRKRGAVTEVAIPVFSGEPFPMMPVFCLGRAETIGGSEYIVFTLRNGNL